MNMCKECFVSEIDAPSPASAIALQEKYIKTYRNIQV